MVESQYLSSSNDVELTAIFAWKNVISERVNGGKWFALLLHYLSGRKLAKRQLVLVETYYYSLFIK